MELTGTAFDRPISAETSLKYEFSRRLEQGEINLPLLPRVAAEVLALVSSPDADARQLSSLIHQDQALAGHVLRIANSAAYRPAVPIVSLQQAVARLGFDLLAQMALAASLQGGVFSAPGFEAELGRLWRHSVASGSYGKEVARVRRNNVEAAYLCGLLHQIGTPVALQALVDIRARHEIPVSRDEILAIANQFTIRVGILLATEWQLPTQVREAIEFRVDYESARTCRSEAMITNFAHKLAMHLLDPESLDLQSMRKLAVVRDLNLYPNDIDTILSRGQRITALLEAMS